MAELDERIENGLNEGRMLLLGGQVIVGLSYNICFQPGFARIPFSAQVSEVVAIVIMTAALGWLLWPAAFHQIVERGDGTRATDAFTTAVLDWGLLPFAVGLGLSLYPASTAVGVQHPLIVAIAGAAFALSVWYVWTLVTRRHKESRSLHLLNAGKSLHKPQENQSDLSSRIKFVLIECRMALPGAQAFLGFQFVIIFTEAFARLGPALRWIHLASLLATTIAIVLLIAPAAYHRIAEGGENSEHFHRVAGALLLTALVFLGPGMTGDLVLVIYMFSQSAVLSGFVAAALLLAFYGMWFGFGVRRLKERRLAEAA